MFSLIKKLGIIFFLALLLISCKKEKNNAVSSWQKTSISGDVFKSSYVAYMSVAPIKDSYENRKEYSRILLERKIIADFAESNKYDTLSYVQDAIKRTQDLSAVKYYIRRKVEPRIPEIDEFELRAAFRRKNSSIKLFQIYAATEEQANAYYNEVLKDSSQFESIAKNSMIAAGEAPDSYNMGWVSWNDMDLAPEIEAFGLIENAISEPVKSLNGWHIFKVTEKKETFFADQTTFENSKEILLSELTQRKFEEESTRYINSVLDAVSLELYPKNIEGLWGYLAPRLPAQKDELIQFLNSEVQIHTIIENPEYLTLAKVDGKPVTAADFLQRLPSIPYWQLTNNLRPAVETISKDILFAKMAEEDGIYSQPEVVRDKEIERVRVLYNTFTTQFTPSINPEVHIKDWYEKYANNYLENVTLEIRSYSFTSEEKARAALTSYKEISDWEEVLKQNPEFFSLETETLSYELTPNHPAFSIEFQAELQNKKLLWGPYYYDEYWTFFELLERKEIPKTLKEVEPKIVQDIQNNLPSLTHSLLLREVGYDSSSVIYNQQLLKSILPTYFD